MRRPSLSLAAMLTSMALASGIGQSQEAPQADSAHADSARDSHPAAELKATLNPDSGNHQTSTYDEPDAKDGHHPIDWTPWLVIVGVAQTAHLMSRGIMAPQGSLRGQADLGLFVVDDEELKAGRIAFYLCGVARYRGAFDEWHETEFQLIHSPGEDPEHTGFMSFCEDGNKAS